MHSSIDAQMSRSATNVDAPSDNYFYMQEAERINLHVDTSRIKEKTWFLIQKPEKFHSKERKYFFRLGYESESPPLKNQERCQ